MPFALLGQQWQQQQHLSVVFDLFGFIVTEATPWKNWSSTSVCSMSITILKMLGRCCWASWVRAKLLKNFLVSMVMCTGAAVP